MSDLTYTMIGDYQFPNLMPNENTTSPLGKYGRMRKQYLQNHRPVLWNSLRMSASLYPHLQEIDRTAQSRLTQMMPSLMQSVGATEELKAQNPLQWAGLMNTCRKQIEETILVELIYS